MPSAVEVHGATAGSVGGATTRAAPLEYTGRANRELPAENGSPNADAPSNTTKRPSSAPGSEQKSNVYHPKASWRRSKAKHLPCVQDPENGQVLADDREVLILSRELGHAIRDVLDDQQVLLIDIILLPAPLARSGITA